MHLYTSVCISACASPRPLRQVMHVSCALWLTEITCLTTVRTLRLHARRPAPLCLAALPLCIHTNAPAESLPCMQHRGLHPSRLASLTQWSIFIRHIGWTGRGGSRGSSWGQLHQLRGLWCSGRFHCNWSGGRRRLQHGVFNPPEEGLIILLLQSRPAIVLLDVARLSCGIMILFNNFKWDNGISQD